jgi:hypothetical protein
MLYAIEYCTHTIMKIGSTRFSKVLMSILAGSIGTVILAAFLTGMSYQASIGNLLPVLIGFNAALSGYMVLEKTRKAFKYKRVAAVGTGVVMVVVTAYLLNLLFLRGAGFHLIGIGEFITLLGVGILTSLLGGILAIKYFKLDAESV